jgi:type II secretory pathway component PulF
MSEASILCFAILAVYLVLGCKKPGLAFTTLPVAIGVVWFLAVATETVENVLVMIPTIFIGTLAAIAATGRDRQNRQWFHWGAWYLLIGIAATVLMGVFLVGVGALAAGYVVAAVLLCSVIAVSVSLIRYTLTGSRRTGVNVFSTIAAVVRQNLPLSMALDCAAIGAEHGPAAVLRDIKSRLVRGCSLTEALRDGYPRCPAGALAMVAAGERIGQLPAALAAVEIDMKAWSLDSRRLRPVHPFYPAFVVALVVILTLGLMTFVLPPFVSTLSEMVGGRLPAATRILLYLAKAFAHGPYAAIAILAVVLIGLSRRIYRVSRQRLDRLSVVRRLGDSLLWFLPVVRRFQRDGSLVRSLGLLRISLIAGCPVNDAIRGTLDLDVNWWFRRRLQCWLTSVERGEDIAESARRCGLGRALAWAFDGGGGDTPAILEMLESHYRSLYLYRLNLTRYILWPVGILLLGLMVGFVAYAVFSPAVAIVNSMALNVYP